MGARENSVELAVVARKSYWRATDARVVIRAWRQSGQSQARFAQQYGLDAKRIGRWASRLAQSESAHGAAAPLRFHPVHVIHPVGGAAGTAWAVEIALDGGRTLRVPAGFAADDLARAMAVLDHAVAALER